MNCANFQANLLSSRTNNFLYGLIYNFPGLYFRQIQRTSDIPIGTLNHRLGQLNKYNLIIGDIILKKKRFFVSSVNAEERKLIGILREAKIKEIIKIIQNKNSINYEYLSEELNITKSTVSWHIRRLENEGILKIENNQCGRTYFLKDSSMIDNVLSKYEKSFSEKMLNNFMSMWEF